MDDLEFYCFNLDIALLHVVFVRKSFVFFLMWKNVSQFSWLDQF